MEVTKTLSSFAKEIVSRIKGDNAEVVAQQNERKALSAFNGQIQALKSKLVDDEMYLEDKKETFNNTLYPTVRISHNQSYVEEVKRAKDGITKAEEQLQDTKDSITFFEQLVKEKF